jgi:hypothetical protein
MLAQFIHLFLYKRDCACPQDSNCSALCLHTGQQLLYTSPLTAMLTNRHIKQYPVLYTNIILLVLPHTLPFCVTACSAVPATILLQCWFNILQFILHFYSPYLQTCWEHCPSARRRHIRQTQSMSIKFYKFSKTTESNQ